MAHIRPAQVPGFCFCGVESAALVLKAVRPVATLRGGIRTEVDALKRLQAETAAELDALLPAILDRAFKGRL
jgi:hypothetical protein